MGAFVRMHPFNSIRSLIAKSDLLRQTSDEFDREGEKIIICIVFAGSHLNTISTDGPVTIWLTMKHACLDDRYIGIPIHSLLKTQPQSGGFEGS